MNTRRRARGQGTAAMLLLAALFLQGCFAGRVTDHRAAMYRPAVSARDPAAWTRTLESQNAAQSRSQGTKSAAAGATNTVPDRLSRTLKPGDRLIIYLHDIPPPNDVKCVIDEEGTVNLPLIGRSNIGGKRTSEAEDMIQKAYIDGFYKKITVSIVAQEEEYFVQGEVKREGRYPLSGEITLLQAIVTAGGYTDFATRTRVRVIRGKKVSVHNCDKIEERKAEDPLIKAGDIIVVPRKWSF